MSKLAALAAVTLVTALARTAHAAPASYVSAGRQVGNDLGLASALDLDAGVALGPLPLLAHVALARGSFVGLEEAIGSNNDSAFYHGQGSFYQLRAGVEHERCTAHGGACLILGADLGYLRSSATSGPWTDTPSVRYTQYQAIPRAGGDFGGDQLRLRITLDIAYGRTARSSADRIGSTKVLSEALKLSVQERVRVAEKLLESADAEGYEDESEVAIHAAWADEVQQRSGDLKDGSVRGLSIEEARRIVASDPADDDR